MWVLLGGCIVAVVAVVARAEVKIARIQAKAGQADRLGGAEQAGQPSSASVVLRWRSPGTLYSRAMPVMVPSVHGVCGASAP